MKPNFLGYKTNLVTTETKVIIEIKRAHIRNIFEMAYFVSASSTLLTNLKQYVVVFESTIAKLLQNVLLFQRPEIEK